MTIAMFSLIVFSLVMFATINQNFVNLFLGDEANAGWDVRADSHSANPIGDGAAFGHCWTRRRSIPAVRCRWRWARRIRRPDPAAGRPSRTYAIQGMDAVLDRELELSFQPRAEGYETTRRSSRPCGTSPTSR